VEHGQHRVADLAGAGQQVVPLDLLEHAEHATGLPLNVPPSPPAGTSSISSARPVTAAIGSPPPRPGE
jgi:hypothetical protein